MAEVFDGTVEVKNVPAGSTRITLNGQRGDLTAGGQGSNGKINLLNQAGKTVALIGVNDPGPFGVTSHSRLLIYDIDGTPSMS